MEIAVGDIVRLKKRHPCGSSEWQVVRVGADIAIKCRGCSPMVPLQRPDFVRTAKQFISDFGQELTAE